MRFQAYQYDENGNFFGNGPSTWESSSSDYSLQVLAVAFAAFIVWLGVRIINRQERWAKQALAVATALPVMYALGFGPACWLSSRCETGAAAVSFAYRPLIGYCPKPAQPIIEGYSRVFAAEGWNWMPGIGVCVDGRFNLIAPTEWGHASVGTTPCSSAAI